MGFVFSGLILSRTDPEPVRDKINPEKIEDLQTKQEISKSGGITTGGKRGHGFGNILSDHF